jgi:hypothetical protein
MVAQAIVAVLQQGIMDKGARGQGKVRSHDATALKPSDPSSFIARPPITSSSGFRRLQCHAAEESGGPKFYPSVLWPPYRRPSFSRHGQRARQAKKYFKGGPAARRGLYVLLPAVSPSAQPSPSCLASVSPSACGSSACSSARLPGIVIIRASRAASSASVMSLSRFVIASAERCRSRDNCPKVVQF